MSRRAAGPPATRSPARLLGSCVAIAVVLVGVPALLVGLSRSALDAAHPVPGVGTVDEIRAYLGRGLSMVELTPLAVRALLCVAWLLWSAIVVSLLGSVAESRLGSRLGLPRFGALGSPGAWIVAGFATLGSLAPAGAFAGGATTVPFTLNQSYGTVEAARAVAVQHDSVAVPAGHAEVRAGESAETFAARVLGAAERWEEIWQLNRDRAVGPAAEPWSEAWNLLPGSILRLPAGAVAAPPGAPAREGDADDRGIARRVEAGDSYWAIAADALGPSAGRGDVADLTTALVDGNAPRLGHRDPERLHPGDVVYVDVVGPDVDEPADVRDPVADSAQPVAVLAAGADSPTAADVLAHDAVGEYVVVADDSYWSIAERIAVERHGADGVDSGAVYDLMVELRARNAPLLGHADPDRLHVGDVLWLADAADLAAADHVPGERAVVDPAADEAVETGGLVGGTGPATAGARAVAATAASHVARRVVGAAQQLDLMGVAEDAAGAAHAAASDRAVAAHADAAAHPLPTDPPVHERVVVGDVATGQVVATSAPASSLAPPVAAAQPDRGGDTPAERSAPAPVGLGESALLAAGLLGLLAARRRRRLRAAEPPARVPIVRPVDAALEQQLRAIGGDDRAVRVDIALRALAAAVADAGQRVTVVRAASDGALGVLLSGPAQLPPPWSAGASAAEWELAGSVTLDELSPFARSAGAPCLLMAQVGVCPNGDEVLVDLEGLELLAIGGATAARTAVAHAIAIGVASCELAASAQLIAVGVDPDALLGHPHVHVVADVAAAIVTARALAGSMSELGRSTFELRARRTGGETWDPVVVIVAAPAEQSDLDELLVLSSTPGIAVVIAGDVPGARWIVAPATAAVDAVDADAEIDSDRDPGTVAVGARHADAPWRLAPLGWQLRPVAADPSAVDAVGSLLTSPTVVADARDADPAAARDVDRSTTVRHPAVATRLAPISEWASAVIVGGRADDGTALDDGTVTGTDVASLDLHIGTGATPLATMRLMGPVEVRDAGGSAVSFERAKPLELLAWMATHRHHSTRTGARTAMWLTDVRDATFANVVSEARRTMIKAIPLPAGEEWVGRTLNEQLVLHAGMFTDADMIVAALDDSDDLDDGAALRRLRPAVEMIRGVPFAGTEYLWPDAEGLTAELVLLATTVTSRYAEHALACGDVDGVFWATGAGLQVIAGQESLIALRMRAHAERGDHSGVRVEWESYQRVVTTDPWGDGELSPKLVELRRELLAS